MAKIVPSTLAPSEPFKLVFADATIDLDGSKKTSSVESDDAAVLRNAENHPWVSVEYGKTDIFVGDYKVDLDPTKDPLSAVHPSAKEATSAEAARAFAKAEEPVVVTAIDAGLDQDKKITDGIVAKTVAADTAATDKATSKETK